MSFRRMIFAVFTVAAAALCMFTWALPCAAESAYDALCDTADPAAFALPEHVQTALSDAGISPEEPESLLSVSPAAFVGSLMDMLRSEASAPFRLCGALLALTLLSALLGSTTDTAASGGMKQLADTLSVLLCAGGAAQPLCACLIRTAQTLEDGRVFMLSFVPVFAAFLAAGGAVAGGASYQVLVLFLTEGIMQLTAAFLCPLLQLAAGAGIVDAVNPALRLSGFVRGLHKAVTWSLGFLMALFSALLSIRSFVASAADSLGSKTVRLLASSLIPVVGSSVSDAYGTVQGSIVLLRNGVGAFGILALICLTLPPMLSLLLYRAVFALGCAAAELAGTASLATLFRHAQSVLSAAFAMLVCFALMLIFSSAIMLLLIGGK